MLGTYGMVSGQAKLDIEIPAFSLDSAYAKPTINDDSNSWISIFHRDRSRCRSRAGRGAGNNHQHGASASVKSCNASRRASGKRIRRYLYQARARHE
jgi:hypothetical protein